MFDVALKISGRIQRTAVAESRKRGSDLKRYGLDAKYTENLLLEVIRFSLQNPELNVDQLGAKFADHLRTSTEEYAVQYRTARVGADLRPSYDKAVKAGTDPVEFIRADLGIPREDAEAAVARMQQEDAEVAETLAEMQPEATEESNSDEVAEDEVEDNDDWDEGVTSPGPAPELFAGAVPHQDDRHSAGTYS